MSIQIFFRVLFKVRLKAIFPPLYSGILQFMKTNLKCVLAISWWDAILLILSIKNTMFRHICLFLSYLLFVWKVLFNKLYEVCISVRKDKTHKYNVGSVNTWKIVKGERKNSGVERGLLLIQNIQEKLSNTMAIKLESEWRDVLENPITRKQKYQFKGSELEAGQVSLRNK